MYYGTVNVMGNTLVCQVHQLYWATNVGSEFVVSKVCSQGNQKARAAKKCQQLKVSHQPLYNLYAGG